MGLSYYVKWKYDVSKLGIKMIKYIELVRHALFFAFAIPISIIDAQTLRIPDALSLGGIAAFLLYELLFPTSVLLSRILGGSFGFLLFLLLRETTKGLGFGDVKYAAFIGIYAGFRLSFVVLLCASCLALFYALISRHLKNDGYKVRIPFAPFLTVGSVCATLWGWSQNVWGGTSWP